MNFTKVSVGSIEFLLDRQAGYFDARTFCEDHNKDLDEWAELNAELLDWFTTNYRIDSVIDEDYYHMMLVPLIAIWCDPMYFEDIQAYYWQEPQIIAVDPTNDLDLDMMDF